MSAVHCPTTTGSVRTNDRVARSLRLGAAAILCLGPAHGAQAQALFTSGFESDAVAAFDCEDEAIAPAALVREDRSWTSAWSSSNGAFVPVFPAGLADRVAIGADKSGYLAVPFVAPDNTSVSITFDHAQANFQYGYLKPRVNNGGMFIGISPCAGDLRPTDNHSDDPFQHTACRRFSTLGGLTWSTTVSSPAVCRLVAGKQYYLTITPRNPDVDLAVETCMNPEFEGCDVQALHKVVQP